MDIKEILNRTDRFAANAGCRLTEVDDEHAVAGMGYRKSMPLPISHKEA